MSDTRGDGNGLESDSKSTAPESMCNARESTSVYESFHAYMGATKDVTSFKPEPMSNTPVSKSIAREFTSVYESLREFTSVSMRSLMFQVVPGASYQIHRARQ